MPAFGRFRHLGFLPIGPKRAFHNYLSVKIMKHTLLTLVTLGSFAAFSNASIIITGLFDGPLPGGDPKGVELYVVATTDLSLYAIGSANNGGGTDGPESGALASTSTTVTAGSFLYLTNGDGTDFTQWFGFAPTVASVPNGAVSHNGDDAIELFFDSTGSFTGSETVVDTFGDINTDGSGTAWDNLDGWAYRNDGVGANGGSFDASNWFFSGINEWDGDDLPDDTGTNTTATPPFPIGTFVIPEPSATLLGGLGLLTLLRRRR